MSKKQILKFIIESFIILCFLMVIGSGVVQSPLFGDINVIDEGQFGAWMSHMLHGEYLYKDVYTAYGPFYIFPLYLLAKIFGPSVFLLRVVYKVIFVFFAITIARVIMTKLRIAYFTQILFVCLLLVIPDFGMRQGVGLLSVFLLSIALESRKLFICALLGFFLCVSFLVSSEIGIFVMSISAFFFFEKFITEKNLKNIFIMFSVVVGCVIILFSIFYLWSMREGWFFSYIQSMASDLRIFSGIDLPNGQNFPNALLLFPHTVNFFSWFKYFVSKELLLYWLFLFYGITFLYIFIQLTLRKAKNDLLLLIALTLFGLFLSTILIGRSGHFSFTLPPFFIIMAYFFDRLIKIYPDQKNHTGRVTIICCILAICFFSVRIVSLYRPNFIKVLSIPVALFHRQENLDFVGPVSLSALQRQSILDIQHFVFSTTSKKDKVFFLSNEPIMYLLVDRDNPTRYDYPYIADTREKRLELLADLTKNPPRYIFLNKSTWDVDGVSNLERLPEVVSFLKDSYSAEKKIRDIVVYEEKIR